MKYPQAGTLQRQLTTQLTANPRRNASSLKQPLSREQAIKQFKELLIDPDPNSLEIAQDVLLEAGLKLADIGEQMAKEGPENEQGETKGWADDFQSTGEFILSRTQDPDADDWMAVSWMVWGKPMSRSPSRAAFGRRIEIVVAYKGAVWSETMRGVSETAQAGIPARYRRALAEEPSIIPPLAVNITLNNARRIAAVLAWHVAKELKRHTQTGSDVVDVISGLRHLDTAKRIPPELVDNPGDDGDEPEANASGNWEVVTPTGGLEGIFAREDEAHQLAEELQRSGVPAKAQRRKHASTYAQTAPSHNPAMPPDAEQARDRFFELLRDPDPNGMEIAQDILLEYKFSLADLSSSFSSHKGSSYIDDGIFYLSPFNPADAPRTQVFWYVEHGGYRVRGASSSKTFGMGIQWMWQRRVGHGGMEGLDKRVHTGRTYRSLEEARRSAAADAWAIAKALKQLDPNAEYGDVKEAVQRAYIGEGDVTPPEVYEHKSTRKKPLTYAEAQEAIFTDLQRAGWVMQTNLRLPHATSPNGRLRLWFKPQAVHVTIASGFIGGLASGHSQSNMHSISYDLDIRKMTPAEFLGYIKRRFPKALALKGSST